MSAADNRRAIGVRRKSLMLGAGLKERLRRRPAFPPTKSANRPFCRGRVVTVSDTLGDGGYVRLYDTSLNRDRWLSLGDGHKLRTRPPNFWLPDDKKSVKP